MGLTTNAKRIWKWMKIYPNCHWCGIKMVKPRKTPEILPDNYPTVDHLASRKSMNERLSRMYMGIARNDGYGVYYVIACRKCNAIRSKYQSKGIEMPSQFKLGGGNLLSYEK